MEFTIDFERLKKTREIGHCLCNLMEQCPCDSFLSKNHECKCGVYKKIE